MRLTPTQLRDFYSEKLRDGRMDGKEGGLSPRTVKYLHSIMRESLQHAFEQGLVNRNVADAVKPPKGIRPQIRVWNAAEARTFLTMAQGAPYAPLWLILLATGMAGSQLRTPLLVISLVYHEKHGEPGGIRTHDQWIKSRNKTIRSCLIESDSVSLCKGKYILGDVFCRIPRGSI
jgi:hypothetical protein